MTATHPTMHGEHRSWESEISLWRDDLRVWQQELAKVQGEIELCKHDLQRHVHALRQHGAAIRLHEQDFGEHEHALPTACAGKSTLNAKGWEAARGAARAGAQQDMRARYRQGIVQPELLAEKLVGGHLLLREPAYGVAACTSDPNTEKQ